MGEIKFRVWNEESKRMCEEESLSSWLHTSQNNGIAMGMAQMPQESPDNRETHIDHLEVMQYTGLKDKNGVEAYFDDLERLTDCIWQIVWDEPCACVMLRLVSGKHLMKEIPAHNIPKGEIIGNIHSDPELLK